MTHEATGTAGSRLNPKWNWHFKVLLRLNGALIETSKATSPAQPVKIAHADSDDRASGILFAELAMEKDPLREVSDALRRIQEGTYGICEETKLPISPDRLRALPWTRYCREAAATGWKPLK
jgi:RNA polymerase-binding transcription factor DksA